MQLNRPLRGTAVLLLGLAACSSSPAPAAAPASAAPGTPAPPARRPVAEDPDLQAERARLLESDTPDERAKAFQRFFIHVGRGRLEELEDDPDVGIALQASWENHRIPLPGAGVKTPVTVDPEEMGFFLKEVSERTGVKIPDSWKAALLHAHVSTSFGEHSTLGWGIESPGSQTSLATTAGSLVARPETRGGYPYVLSCEGKWTTQVWASGRTGLFTGWGPHEVILTGDAHRVLVFGWESHAAYVEAFDMATGSPLFRFCTSYWCHGSEDWVFPRDRIDDSSGASGSAKSKKHKRQSP
jgi:hypothetical protein